MKNVITRVKMSACLCQSRYHTGTGWFCLWAIMCYTVIIQACGALGLMFCPNSSRRHIFKHLASLISHNIYCYWHAPSSLFTCACRPFKFTSFSFYMFTSHFFHWAERSPLDLLIFPHLPPKIQPCTSSQYTSCQWTII